MITIPVTTPRNYLSTIVALNIRSPESTGDWHSSSTFSNDKLPLENYFFGDNQPKNTNHLLDDMGVIDGTERLNRMGYFPENTPVWIADHPRACVDYLYYTVLKTGILGYITLDDWFPSIEDKQRVYQLLDVMEPYLTSREREILSQWKQQNPLS